MIAKEEILTLFGHQYADQLADENVMWDPRIMLTLMVAVLKRKARRKRAALPEIGKCGITFQARVENYCDQEEWTQVQEKVGRLRELASYYDLGDI